MRTEKNSRLYWGWFGAFFVLLIAAYAISKVMEHRFQPSLIGVAVVLVPIPIMGVFGLLRDYFPGHWYGEIIRGRQAVLWNSIFIALYVCILAYIGLRS